MSWTMRRKIEENREKIVTLAESFSGYAVYSMMDLFAGYDQRPLHVDSQDMTTVTIFLLFPSLFLFIIHHISHRPAPGLITYVSCFYLLALSSSSLHVVPLWYSHRCSLCTASGRFFSLLLPHCHGHYLLDHSLSRMVCAPDYSQRPIMFHDLLSLLKYPVATWCTTYILDLQWLQKPLQCLTVMQCTKRTANTKRNHIKLCWRDR